jgi:chaperonin GroES
MNTSGITPVEYNVLIRQERVEERTKGGLVLPGETQEREKHAQTRGVIVAVSPMAFTFDDWPVEEPKPQVGQRVVFAKHSGTFVTGEDGEEYRVIKDRDIVGVMQ